MYISPTVPLLELVKLWDPIVPCLESLDPGFSLKNPIVAGDFIPIVEVVYPTGAVLGSYGFNLKMKLHYINSTTATEKLFIEWKKLK